MATESTDSYRIVEHDPQSQASPYLPSSLIQAEHNGDAIHILFAVDVEGETVRVITTYRPDPSEWEIDFLRRKRS